MHAIQVGSMIQKADVESTTFEKFWQAVQQTYSNGTYRVGPLLQVCLFFPFLLHFLHYEYYCIQQDRKLNAIEISSVTSSPTI